jgi:hypothetical protein
VQLELVADVTSFTGPATEAPFAGEVTRAFRACPGPGEFTIRLYA